MCPKCQCEKRVKNGVLNGKQRYKCKQYGCNYTITYQENAEKEKKRRFALSMYLEGLGFHSIGRLLGVSHASVINWVRKYGQNLSDIRNCKPVKIIELDELHTYIQHKKTTFGYGLLLIETSENSLISWWEIEVPKQE